MDVRAALDAVSQWMAWVGNFGPASVRLVLLCLCGAAVAKLYQPEPAHSSQPCRRRECLELSYQRWQRTKLRPRAVTRLAIREALPTSRYMSRCQWRSHLRERARDECPGPAANTTGGSDATRISPHAEGVRAVTIGLHSAHGQGSHSGLDPDSFENRNILALSLNSLYGRARHTRV